jgi:hypothetical protein
LANPSAIGWVNRIPGIADTRDVLDAERQGSTGGITRASVAGAGQLIIYDNTGKAVNIEELKRSRQIPTIKDPPSLALQKIDRMIQMAREGADFMRNTYKPEYGFKPMLAPQTPGVPPLTPEERRAKMAATTGAYKP